MPGTFQYAIVAIASALAFYYSGKMPLVIRKLNEIVHGKPGCNPLPKIDNFTLHYFATRGRAEAIRLILEESQIPYKEVLFNKETWPKHKANGIASGLLTFGQVPAAEVDDGVRLVQSQVITRYIGRAAGMDCNCEDLHTCEIIALGAEDTRTRLSKMLYNPPYTLKDREEYLTSTLPMWLAHFEKIAPPLTQQVEAYFTSGRLTWVDVLVFDLLDVNIEFGQFDFGPKVKKINVLEAFPKLQNFYILFKRRSNIAKYLSSERRHGYTIPNLPVDMSSQ